jgi:hypothetical protein
VRTLECDYSLLAAAVPEIEKLAEGTKLGETLEAIHEEAAMNMKTSGFEKCNWIFQLAHVLTAPGREDARH